MSHTCEACVVTCEDFRLHYRKDGRNYIGDFIKALNADCDLVARAGAVQDLVRPKGTSDETLLRDIGVSVNLHKAKTIYLINHEDCGAYASLAFKTRDEELDQHYKDLRAAQKILMDKFYYPGIQVALRFAELVPGTNDQFVIKEVE
jgi:carbonic anhydrase